MNQTILLFTVRPGVTDEQIDTLRSDALGGVPGMSAVSRRLVG